LSVKADALRRLEPDGDWKVPARKVEAEAVATERSTAAKDSAGRRRRNGRLIRRPPWSLLEGARGVFPKIGRVLVGRRCCIEGNSTAHQ
jgi:hypothetical protein